MSNYPSYLALYETGQLKDRVEKAVSMLEDCSVCPNNCGINRLNDNRAFCKVGRYVRVASYFPHRGEEFPIRGYRGSGTIFFSYCNMRCVYCQNFEVSQLGEGEEVTSKELADIMLSLQKAGCHNINFVSPSHVVPQILEAVYTAVEKGLKIPLVYNTSSFDSLESLKLLDGVIDIYLPDVKYLNDKYGKEFSMVDNYSKTAKIAIREMYRQVGDLVTDEKGIARKGLLVRHLVLPNDISTTKETIRFLREVSPNMAVNIMNQYFPTYKAYKYPLINRRTNYKEYEEAVSFAKDLGLRIVGG
ncbi:MAG: radical SAM protein [Aquificae bacterium]|nr:radical SAM protein [Aquificota bacterium]